MLRIPGHFGTWCDVISKVLIIRPNIITRVTVYKIYDSVVSLYGIIALQKFRHFFKTRQIYVNVYNIADASLICFGTKSRSELANSWHRRINGLHRTSEQGGLPLWDNFLAQVSL